jgi:hypothetical protein
MVVTSLHKITNNILLKRGYSTHWYLQFLVYSKDCLRELSLDGEIDTLRSVLLPLNDNNAIEIPNDYVDYARVSARQGQYLHPLVEDNSLNIIPNYDSDFVLQPFAEDTIDTTASAAAIYYSGYMSPYWWLTNFNNFGENTGRFFGGVGGMSDTFRVNKQRNEIKINENLAITHAVLEYVGDGTSADSATQIDVNAFATIEAYALWQFKEHNRTYSPSEAEMQRQIYINERQILRARKSDLDLIKLKRIIQHSNISVKY